MSSGTNTEEHAPNQRVPQRHLAAHAAKKVAFHQQKSTTFRLFALVAILLVPTLCTVLLTLGVFDPLGNMKQVPAVIVNQDVGAEVNGEERNIGQELVEQLIDDNSVSVEGAVSGFNWKFTSDLQQASDGLQNGEYYVELVIPAGFSEAIASTYGTSPKSAQIQVYYNPSLGYTAQQIGQSFVTGLVEKLSQSVQTDNLSTMFLSVQDAESNLTALGNAGLDLTDGLNEAADGANQLASGTAQLSDGVSQLADGLAQLKSGLETSTSSPETAALSAAMAEVGENLKLYGAEAAKEEPDASLEQAYLNAAATAAQKAAAANATLGDPLAA